MFSNNKNNKISIIFPYYKNPIMLEKQIEIWKTYPDNIEIILVDDGSPLGLRAEEVIDNKKISLNNFQLYRILVDIPWNMSGARNTGVKFANNKWILWCDIDHIIPIETINALSNLKLDENKNYNFKRRYYFEENGGKGEKEPHRETLLLNKKLLKKIIGFDESFTGVYGFPERDFFDRLDMKYKKEILNLYIEYVQRRKIQDSCTDSIDRKENRDLNDLENIKIWKKENKIGISVCKFPYKKII